MKVEGWLRRLTPPQLPTVDDMNTTIRTALVYTGLIAALLTGCGNPSTRTGATAQPVTLRPATGGGPGVGNDVMDALAVATKEGSVHVAAPPDADQMTPGADRTLELLTTDAADIGVVRSGALVAAGAGSLKGLQAPFVVVNNEQAAAIAADAIADTAMADLSRVHLVGLALVPGGLRHPFGYGSKPLLGASDYRSAAIAVPIVQDSGVEAMMTALGAIPDHSIGEERTAKVKDGQLRGIEISLHQFGAVDLPAVVTTNVTFYTKFDVIVVREALWQSLTTIQQAELRSAAAAVRVSAPAARGSEQSVFADWCREPGADAARANDAELKSLHRALDPITTALESDPVAKTVIDRMRALHAGTTDEPTDLTCAPHQPSAATWRNLKPVGDQTVLDGTWRFTPTEAELTKAGLSASDARNNAIVWEMTLKNGKGTATVGGGGHTCQWIFTFAGTKVLFDHTDGESCGGMVAGTYERTADVATFHWTDADDAYGLILNQGIFAKAVRVTR
jgi:TRAP-type C4-dicarboxylate transport system substrate-binding protein